MHPVKKKKTAQNRTVFLVICNLYFDKLSNKLVTHYLFTTFLVTIPSSVCMRMK